MGSRLKRKSATMAGFAPIPNHGIRSTSSASAGMVCTIEVAASTISPNRGQR